ncbi:MAG: hypothetical protein JNM27_23135 [Leptospirales bacterium]|nr:hypothetical protein [Leptospirales bacterium]
MTFLLLLSLFVIQTGLHAQEEKEITSVRTSSKGTIVLRRGRMLTDRGWQNYAGYSVIVDTDPRMDFPAECNLDQTPELSLGPKAERAAVRCAKGAPWTVYFLRKSAPRAFLMCSGVQLLDWKIVPSFAQERPNLLKCAAPETGPFENSFKEILKESKRSGGEDEVLTFLIQTLELDTGGVMDPASGDEWDKAWRELGRSSKQKGSVRLHEALRPGSSRYALFRSLRHLDLNQMPQSLEKTAEYLADLPEPEGLGGFREVMLQRAALDIALRRLAWSNSAASARLACRYSARSAQNGKSVFLPRSQLALFVKEKTKCSIDPVFERGTCNITFLCCPRGFTCADTVRKECTDQQIRDLSELELSRPPQEPWPPMGGGTGFELLLGTARIQNTDAARKLMTRVAPGCKE